MPEYALYGLVIRSDRVLESLDAALPGSRVDVDIVLAGERQDPDDWSAAATHYAGPSAPGEPPSVVVRRDAERGFWFRYADGTEFVLDAAATSIRAWWADASTIEDTTTYLLGPVLGFALRLRGVLAFHASAVLIAGRAVKLEGRGGENKK